MKPVVWTLHARTACEERRLEAEWVVQTVAEPDWTEADPRAPDVGRRFRRFDHLGGRVLRVVCFETEAEIRVLTAFVDRGARGRPG